MADDNHFGELLSGDNDQIIDVDATEDTADNEDLLADNMTIQAENVADNMADDRQDIDIFLKISILELQKKYQIGRDGLYKRMAYLNITPWKLSGRSYLDAEQVAHMDGLDRHVDAKGRMKGYPKPEPTGPKTEPKKRQTEPKKEQTSAITTTQASAPVQQTIVDTVEEEELEFSECRQESNPDLEAIAAVVNSAQKKAVGVLIAENRLAQQFIKNPNSLPEELKAQIRESSKVPDIDPLAYANSLVRLANSRSVAV
jgi:hypothetical protein